MQSGEINKFLVGIRCHTYNQSRYIVETMNGFAMQQTLFPFVAMIVDDASTDGEQQVITDYLEKNFETDNTSVAYKKETDYAYVYFAQHRTNRNCCFVVLLLKENHYQKKSSTKKLEYLAPWREVIRYEAICEGDDWWTDSTKLQKQVDFLDAHPEYQMCTTSYSSVRMTDGYIDKGGERGDGRDITFRQLMKKNRVATLTVMYRIDVFFKYQNEVMPFMPRFMMGDIPLWLYIASQGKIRQLPYDMANYRILASSASHHKDFASQYRFYIEGSRIRLWINRFLGTHYSFYIWARLLIATRNFCRNWARNNGEKRRDLWRKAIKILKSTDWK